jgi:MFS family permease
MRNSYYYGREARGFGIAGAVTWMFVGAYWVLLWRKSIVWTPERRGWTFGALFGGMLVAAVVGGAMGGVVGAEFGWFIGSITAPVLWLVATVLIWRESAGERAARLANSGRDAIVCPTCGYNLTGLRETRCPECGTQFTIDQLLASQPGRVGADLES